MVEITLDGQMEIIARHEIERLPVNLTGTIVKSYNDGRCDVETSNGIISYVMCIGDNSVGNNCLITFLNNDNNQPVAVTDNSALIGDINEYINR